MFIVANLSKIHFIIIIQKIAYEIFQIDSNLLYKECLINYPKAIKFMFQYI